MRKSFGTCIIVFAFAWSAGAAAQLVASPVPEIAADPAAEALLKRYQAASDPREAQRVFDEIKAAGEKSPRAAYLCGAIAAQAGSAVADRAVAQHCLESAARRGVAEAQHRLAMLLIGEGADGARRAEAEKWLTAAAASLPESVYALALLKAQQQPDAETARLDVLRKAAEMNYAPAQYELARALYGRNTAAALELLDKAARQRHAEAAAELALLLERDKRPADVPRIVALLTSASEAGLPRADYALAQRYAQADGVKRDTERAFMLIRRSANAGHLPSVYALGHYLSHGIGTASDEALALEWFRRAADRGHLEAQIAIANAYANGWGVGKSMDLAYKWYCKAAQGGHAAARAMVERSALRSECDLPPASSQPRSPQPGNGERGRAAN